MWWIGSYAKVREAVDSITQRRVAIKILSKRKLKKLPGGESSVKKEIDVLNKLRHCNVVELIDYFTIEEKEKMYPMLTPLLHSFSPSFLSSFYSLHHFSIFYFIFCLFILLLLCLFYLIYL